MARWIVDTPESPVRDRMRGKLAQNQMLARNGRLERRRPAALAVRRRAG